MNSCEVREIPLTQGKMALVDAEDFERLALHKWHAAKRADGRTFYARRKVRKNGKQQTIFMHREILGVDSQVFVDHKNGNGLNNRKTNLRTSTALQNSQNIRVVRSPTGFKGVCSISHRRPTSKPFVAQITVNKVVKHVGCFATAEEAGAAYDQAAIHYFGEFAATNAELRGARA